MSETTSSKSVPTSLLPMPSSLFGSFSTPTASAKPLTPKKQGRVIPKKKTRKHHQKPKTEAFIMANNQVILEPAPRASSPSVIAQLQSRKETYEFLEGETAEPVHNEPETKSPGTPCIQGETNVSRIVDWTSRDKDTAEDEESVDNDDDSDYDEYETHGDCLETVINRGLFQLPCTNGLIDTFSTGVKSYILNKLLGMSKDEPTPDIVLEIADSIDLLRLLGASDPTLDDIGEKLGEGVALYNRGMKKLNEGQDLLRSALSDISLLK